jgi:hypothetical protein
VQQAGQRKCPRDINRLYRLHDPRHILCYKHRWMTWEMHLFGGWIGFLAGALSGAALGLAFHRDDWLGGYDSWRRRLLRLGHIACFGMGFLNVMFALSVQARPLGEGWARWASLGWLVALVTMPLCCALAAWRKPLRHLFPIPVVATLVGIGALLIGWGRTL